MLRIGIDLGGTKTEGIVMDHDGRILIRERRPTPQADGYQAILDNIAMLVRDLEQRSQAACHVGIGTPGAISARTGHLKNSNTVCLNGMPVKQDLERLLAREVRIANDANCFALSEALDGAGRGYGVVFGVIMGTGVGGGIVFHGQLHEGPQHIAGEWGHNVLEPDGPPCYCGKRGCVETLLSGPGLVKDYLACGGAAQGRASVAGGTTPGMEEVEQRREQLPRTPGATGDPELDARAILERAAAGDPVAEASMQRYLDRFGRAISVVINILDPDAIVLGGGMSNIARLYTEGRERVEKYVFDAQGSANVAGDRMSRATNNELRTAILPHVHGDSSGVRGAAQLWPVVTS